MIKAIIFDCFGVLTTDGWLKFCDTYATDPVIREQAHKLNRAVDKADITYRDFISQVSQITGVDAREVDKQISEPLPKNVSLLNYIKTLHENYKTAILSNISNPQWFEEYFTEAELGNFDEVVMSSVEGIIKPDPQIFSITADRLGVQLDQCIFVDDRENNTQAAAALGMKAILYKELPQLKSDIKAILNRSE